MQYLWTRYAVGEVKKSCQGLDVLHPHGANTSRSVDEQPDSKCSSIFKRLL